MYLTTPSKMKSPRSIKMRHPASTSTSTPAILNFTFPVLMRLLLVLAVVPSFVQQQVHAQTTAFIVRFSTSIFLGLLVSDLATWPMLGAQAQPLEFRVISGGICQDGQDRRYDYIAYSSSFIQSADECATLCVPCASEVSSSNPNRQFRGFVFVTCDKSESTSMCLLL